MHTKASVATLLTLAMLAIPTSTQFVQRKVLPGSQSSIANLKEKIKTVVFLIMENRSVDNLLGGQLVPGLDNPIYNGPFCNPVDLAHPGPLFCSKANDYNQVLDDPDHSVSGNNIEFYGTFVPNNALVAAGIQKPTLDGFIYEQDRLYNASNITLSSQVMDYYTEEQVPVITALTHDFTVFNHWHSDLPGPTEPNRLYNLAGTSYGHGDNTFAHDTIDTMSIFQAVDERGLSWKNYEFGMDDANYFTWTNINNKSDHIVPMSTFYTDAAAGTLPDFTYLTPNCCAIGTNSMHPTGLITDGEVFLKGIYEALRASPQWDEMLFVLTFDESGGFHDHVPPPLAARPDDLSYTETTPSGANYTFYFDRMGGRVPTWLISPWVTSTVEQQGLNRLGEIMSYSASSLLSTLGYLWDFEPFTPRVEHAPSFDHLILTEKRETPMTLPDVNWF